jgi:upstream activation factor subunit UAF30
MATRTSTGGRAAGGRATGGRAVGGRAAVRTQQKKGTGLAQKVHPDEQLAAVVGSKALPRTQLVKKFWDYIKSQGLQAEKDRRKINADDKLRPLFGGKRQVTMFDVTRILAQHAH